MIFFQLPLDHRWAGGTTTAEAIQPPRPFETRDVGVDQGFAAIWALALKGHDNNYTSRPDSAS